MGVFPVTQRQWEQVMGDRPAYYNNLTVYEERPIENVGLSVIRGSAASGSGYDWPSDGHVVLATSFLGKLRLAVGNLLEFDLPTEAQWEYACRAGTTGAWNNGTTTASDKDVPDANLDLLGRYKLNGGREPGVSADPPSNCTDEYGTAKVGSYLPNNWGLYDMHGNVTEWCLDWYAADASLLGGDDPTGPVSSPDSQRVTHGGCFNSIATRCSSAKRIETLPTQAGRWYGFRIAAPAEVFIAP